MKKKEITSLRDFPSVEILINNARIEKTSRMLARPLVIEVIRQTLDRSKKEFAKSKKALSHAKLVQNICRDINKFELKRIGPVINGTGVLIHTNLGRAPLSSSLYDSIKGQITGYGNLEFDVATGKRGKRGILAEKYLALLSGAEAATIVNNNAASLFIILNSLANRRKVVISRGELVQIGGGFRIPDIMKKSGARLLEIGTSNITSINDYQNTFDQKPAAILKVHRSNFAISGFSEEVSIKSLVKLASKLNIPVINDLGSGVFVNTTEFIGRREPTVQSSVRDGADLTCFSGDKLLGGVQAGLIVGHGGIIAKIKKNPIFRAMRVDKTIFSALETMLGYYLNESWKDNIKLWRLASRSEKELLTMAKDIIARSGSPRILKVIKSDGQMGGGSLPEVPIKSAAIIFDCQTSAQNTSDLFRMARTPVIGRIKDDRFMIDMKAIDDSDIAKLVKVIKAILPKLN